MLPLFLPVIALCLFLTTGTGTAYAHAAYESSSPASGEVVATAPAEITVSFTERLDDSYSRLQIFDQNGNPVDGTELVDGADEYTMVLTLPAGLANGTYSVLWRTLSEDDGHTAQNYFAFTIGSQSDVATVAPPSASLDAGDAPQWAKTISRWLALVGLALLMAVWPIWNIVLRPALRPVWRQAPEAIRRVQQFAVAAVALAVIGTVLALIVQALALTDGSVLERIVNTLGQTRYGQLTLFRLGAFMVLGLVLSTCPWWFRNRRKVEASLAWAATFALPIPFALIAHAYAQPRGQTVAVIADYLHLVGFGVWFGGLVMLAAVLFPVLKRVDPGQRRAVLAIALPRFSTIALTSWGVLGLTGFYAGWLQVGNLTALRTTDYGKALIVKLALLAVVLVLAAINLTIVSRRIARADQPVWHKRLTWLVTAEITLVLLATLAVGQMTSLQPARDQLVEDAQQISIPFDLDDRSARLLIAPGTTGVNHLRLEVSGDSIPTSTEMLLRITMPDRDDLGTREITLARVAGNAFEHHGNEFSISGEWEVTLIERPSGAAPTNAVTTFAISDTRTSVDVPGTPWRFENLGGTTGLLLLVFGIAGLVVAWFAGSSQMRKESGGLAAAAIVLGVILLFQARIDPILANTRGGSALDTSDIAAIQRGEDTYVNACLSCHGADLRGDGPAGEGMQPPPADFSAEHTKVHSVEDLIYWVRNGKQGTGMPAFGNDLSDQEILDVLTFIQARQEADSGSSITPDPAACTVTPLTLDDLAASIGSGSSTSAGDPVVASDPAVSSEVEAAVLQITEQFIACTNGADTMRRLALLTDGQLAATFPNGVDPAFQEAAAQPVTALPAEQWISITGSSSVSQLADGRVMVATTVTDPASTLGAPTSSVSFILTQQDDGTWLIDDIR